MKYKVFISDYDCTLGFRGDIDGETVKAVKEFEHRGGHFVVCTGRMFKNIKSICDKFDIAEVISSYQGARINERISGKTIYASQIPDDLAIDVLNYVKDLPVKPIVLSDDTLHYTEESAYIDFYRNADGVTLSREDDLIKGIEEKKFCAYKINVVCEGITPDEFVKEYGGRYKDKLIVNSGGRVIAEFVNPACSKGAAIRFLAEYYGVSCDEILAVGDSSNDLEMMKGEWHGVAVGDGFDGLKAIADEITVPFSEKPVKRLLEKYCL